VASRGPGGAVCNLADAQLLVILIVGATFLGLASGIRELMHDVTSAQGDVDPLEPAPVSGPATA